ncbi:MAG: PAS domain-containing protein [Burkholderiales bacterium]
MSGFLFTPSRKRTIPWLQASIANRISFAALALTMTFVSIISLVSYGIITVLLEKNIEKDLRHLALLTGQRLELQLNTMQQDIETLSSDSLIANALSDPAVRYFYLQPMLAGHLHALSIPVLLCLYTASGGAVACNNGGSPPRFRDSAWLQNALRSGHTQAEIVTQQNTSYLQLATPVIHPKSNQDAGVLVAKVWLVGLFGDAIAAIDHGQVKRLTSHSTRLVGSLQNTQGSDLLKSRYRLQLTVPMDTLDLAIEIGEHSDQAFAPLRRLAGIYFLLGLLLLPLALWGARSISRRLTLPLATLTRSANAIAETGTYNHLVPFAGHDEVAQLANAFGQMLSRLQTSHTQLELRVAERTEELQRRSNELRARQQEYRVIFNSVRAMIWYIDRDGKILRANARAAQHVGIPARAMIGKTAFDLFPPDFAAAYQADNMSVIASGKESIGSVTLGPLLGGGTGWFQVDRIPSRDDNNRVIGATIFVSDITERKNTELKLHESEERLRTLINATPDAIFFKDKAGRWLEVNQAGLELFHLQQAAYRGKTDIELADATHPLYREAFLGCAASDAIAWNTGALYRVEETIPLPEGGERIFDTLKVPIFHPDGSHKGLVILGRDVTERRMAETQLRKLNETLELRIQEEVSKNREKDHLLIQQSRLAAMGEMIGNIAHQWRQPINALSLLLNNIKDAHRFNELDEQFLDTAAADGDRMIRQMSATIDDFRNFFRPNKTKENFSLQQAVHDALALVEPSFKNCNISITLTDREVPETKGYRNEYSQVLLNILNNAKDAILERKIREGKLDIRLIHEGQLVKVIIRDNGGGIPADTAAKIFDPYFTTKDKGTGIGLYMSKVIIENNMGGTIEFRNHGEGAEFTIATPVSTAAASE